MTTTHPRHEVEQAVAAYVALRERLDRGEEEWAMFAEVFTDDAVFLDPAWGRVEGRAAIAELMTEAMTGLDGFTYPIDVVAIEGDDVVITWHQVVEGLGLSHRGVSMLHYAGAGRFDREEDLMNVAVVGSDLLAAGWQPGPGFTPPPAEPPR